MKAKKKKTATEDLELLVSYAELLSKAPKTKLTNRTSTLKVNDYLLSMAKIKSSSKNISVQSYLFRLYSKEFIRSNRSINDLLTPFVEPKNTYEKIGITKHEAILKRATKYRRINATTSTKNVKFSKYAYDLMQSRSKERIEPLSKYVTKLILKDII